MKNLLQTWKILIRFEASSHNQEWRNDMAFSIYTYITYGS